MKFRQLGRTGLRVSEIGFGCWAIGGSGYGVTDDRESLDALEAAWEHGVNFFDTADTYGHGHSEELLAGFLKERSRDQYVVASKCGWDFYDKAGSRKNFEPEYIRFACEQSLKRLGFEAIDVYQLHNPSLELIERGEAIGELAKLKTQGLIRFAGVSVHTEAEALRVIADGRVDTLQLVFNMLDQRMAARVLGEAESKNIGIIVREPLACGILSGKYDAEHEFAKEDHRRRWTREKRELDLKKLERLKPILSTARLSLVRAALEYVLEYTPVSTVIPGAKKRPQVLENLLATEDPRLRIQEAAQLRDIFRKEPLFQQGLR